MSESTRRRRRATAAAAMVLLVGVSSLGVSPVMADESYTGNVEEGVLEACSGKRLFPKFKIEGLRIYIDPNDPSPYSECVANEAVNASFDAAAMTSSRAGADFYSALFRTLGSLDAIVVGAVGEVAAAVEEATNTVAAVSTSTTAMASGATELASCLPSNLTRPHDCVPITTTRSGSPTSSLEGYSWVGSAKIPMDFEHVDGLYSFELYRADKPARHWRLWGTSVLGSVRGVNGGEVDQIMGTIEPKKSYLEAVAWTPIRATKRTSGTTTLCLEPSAASISVGSYCRDWERTEGETGGYITSSERYEAVWRGSATSSARGVEALQGWKAPDREGVSFEIGGWAWYR